MNQDDLLLLLLRRLNEPAARYSELDRYYNGTQALAFLAPEARRALGNRFGRMASNLPRIAVSSLAERLRVVAFLGDDGVWADWLRNDLDQLSAVAHREALALGDSYVSVWADAYGRPSVSIESAKQVSVLTDPGTRKVTAALKRWEDKHTNTTMVVLYLADRIIKMRSDQVGAVTNTNFKVVDEIANPLGAVPVVRLQNTDRIVVDPDADFGVSEIEDLKPLVDGLNKTLTDMLVTSEFLGRPRRFATGIELAEDEILDADGQPTGEVSEVNPFPETDRMMIAENADAKFGQLAAADLLGYEAAVRVLISQITAVSCLPAHYLGVLTQQPASADALRASEASLTARAEARQQVFGRAWEQVARLMIAVRDGKDPHLVDAIRVEWADASTRSVAQEADAVTKLFAAGLLPQTYALARLGYTEDEIALIAAAGA